MALRNTALRDESMTSQQPYHFEIVEKHISQIYPGMVVDHNGKHVTVGNNDIGYSEFMGNTLFGDSYHCGHKPVKTVSIKVARL